MTSVGTEEAQIPDLQKQRNSVLTVRLSLSFVLVCVCVAEVLQTDRAAPWELVRNANRHAGAAACLLPQRHLQSGLCGRRSLLQEFTPLRICLCLQKKYKDDAERLKERYSLVSETPEMERVRANQRHISSVSVFHSFSCCTDVPAGPAQTALCRPLAAVLLGLQADERPDGARHRNAGDRPCQRERQKDQWCKSTLYRSCTDVFIDFLHVEVYIYIQHEQCVP